MKKLGILFGILFVVCNTALAQDIDVYYFWSNPRCSNCKKMETYTKEVVTNMNDNSVHFKSIDMSINKPLAHKYNLYTKSVIISKTANGKEQWKNLDRIWTRVNNETKFKRYIQDEIIKFKGVK